MFLAKKDGDNQLLVSQALANESYGFMFVRACVRPCVRACATPYLEHPIFLKLGTKLNLCETEKMFQVDF